MDVAVARLPKGASDDAIIQVAIALGECYPDRELEITTLVDGAIALFYHSPSDREQKHELRRELVLAG